MLANPLSASWQFQVSPLSSLFWPSSSVPSSFPLQLSQGPHWEYCSDPGLWAPKPVLILCIDRPENFLPSTAGPAPRHSHFSTLNSQHFSERQRVPGTLPVSSQQIGLVDLMCVIRWLWQAPRCSWECCCCCLSKFSWTSLWSVRWTLNFSNRAFYTVLFQHRLQSQNTFHCTALYNSDF